jgi:hypothetical protein
MDENGWPLMMNMMMQIDAKASKIQAQVDSFYEFPL